MLKLWKIIYVNITLTPNRLFIPKVDQPGLKPRILGGFECLFTIFRSQFCHVQPFFKGVCSYYKSN